MLKNLKKFLPLIILGIVFVGLFLPLEAHAVLGFVANLAIAIVAAIVTAGAQIVIHVTGLSIMLSAWFIRVSMNIPIVDSWARDVGWTLTRDFVNMLFIIILAWIGIATILRLKEYQTGKILIKLLIIALLINFSPVLVGLVVDFSNIIAYYFISGIVERPAPVREGEAEGLASMEGLVATHPDDPEKMGIIASAREAVLAVHARIWGNLRRPVLETTSDLFIIIIYGYLFLMTTIVFFTLAVVFLLRVIAFWILLILAPFAFIAYILPQTNKFFWQWWQQLVQWAFIGITASASVYLSFAFLERSMARGGGGEGEEGVGFEGIGQELVHFEERVAPGFLVEGMSRFLETFLPFIVMLIIMGAGLLLGFVASAAGASTAINFAQTKGSQYTKGGAKRVRESKYGQKAETWAREKGERMPIVGRAMGGIGARRAELSKKAEEERKQFTGLDDQALRDRTKARLNSAQRKALGNEMVSRGLVGNADMDPDFMGKYKSAGGDTTEYAKQRIEYAGDGSPEAIQKAMSKIKTEKMTDIHADSLKNKDVAFNFAQNKAAVTRLIRFGTSEQKARILGTLHRSDPRDETMSDDEKRLVAEAIVRFANDIETPQP